jgi:hypothetical protein
MDKPIEETKDHRVEETEEGFNRSLLYESKRRSMSVLHPSEQQNLN